MEEVILGYLRAKNIYHEILVHPPIYTMQHTTTIAGLSIKQGAKSLLLKVDNEFVLIVLPGNRQLDSKKLKKYLHVKETRFATPDEVKEIMNCEVGSCYPFGNLATIKTLVDVRLSMNSIVSFTPGVHTKSVKVAWRDFYFLTLPELVDVAREK